MTAPATGAAGDGAGALRVTAELSLYPLSDRYLPAVAEFIRVLERFAPAEPAAAPAERLSALRVNQMSTQLSGPLPLVQQAIAAALTEVDAAGYRVALNIKLLNGELPLHDAVDLNAARDG